MRRSVSFWDALFGKKVTIMLPGGPVRVTERWVEQMKREGKMREVDAPRVVRAHIIDPLSLEEVMEGIERPLVRTEPWVVGQQIDQEAYDRLRDPATGDLYVMYHVEDDGEQKVMVLKKELWQAGLDAMQ